MLILCADQATTKNGWAIGDGKGKPISGTFKIPARPEFGERLKFLYDQFEALIDQYKPDIFVYETPMVMHKGGKSNIATIIKLNKVAGVLQLLAAQKGIACEEADPGSWRISLLGFARGPKGSPADFMKRAAFNRLKSIGIECQSFDESDAVGILWHMLHGRPANERAQGNLMDMIQSKL